MLHRHLTAPSIVSPPRSRRSPAKSPDKSDLPVKTCAVCGRPFAWRKKWEKVWNEVRYCSERCRRQRRPEAAP